MLVYKEDLLDPKYKEDIPVYAGCSGGPCACSGACRKIVGMISKKAYEKFMRDYVSEEQFIQNTMRQRRDDEIIKELKYIRINWPTDRQERYRVMMLIKNKFQVDNIGYLNKIVGTNIFARGYGTGHEFFQLLSDNWVEFKKVLDQCNIKSELDYEEK